MANTRNVNKKTPQKKEETVVIVSDAGKEDVIDVAENQSNESANSKEITSPGAPSVDIKTSSASSTKKTFDSGYGVKCRSITVGGLYMTGIKSHIPYEWNDMGDVTEVEYQDIMAAIRSNSDFVYKPYFIIEDADVIAQYPRVESIYKSLYSISELKSVFNLSVSDMIATIDSLPQGVVDSLKHLITKMIASGELDSVRKIKALDDYFGTEFILLTGLFKN